MEHLCVALELHVPIAYRARAGIAAPSGSPVGGKKAAKTPPLTPLSPSSLDARLRSMDFGGGPLCHDPAAPSSTKSVFSDKGG